MTFRCSLIPRFSSSNSYSSSSMSSSRSLSRCLRFSPSASLSLPLPLPLPLPSPSPSASSSAWSTINPSRFVSCASSSSAESITTLCYSKIKILHVSLLVKRMIKTNRDQALIITFGLYKASMHFEFNATHLLLRLRCQELACVFSSF